MAGECLFTPDGDAFQPTEWAVGPWSRDLLQGSAFGGLMVRALELSAAPGMVLARLSFDLWRPVTREPLTPSVAVLREGRKARTVEASLAQGGKPAARCTAVYLKADSSFTPALKEVTFVNADLTLVFRRRPRAPWILLEAETRVGDQGTGVARGTLSDLDGAFGACEQTLLFERRV
jgi:acyl-CoA thioesterase